MNSSVRRASAGILSISLFVMMGQGCPGNNGLPGSHTISELEVTDAVAGDVGHIRVTLVDPVAANTVVSLESSNPAIAEVPATLTIPEGSSSGTVDYAANDVGAVTITAWLHDSQRSAVTHVVGSLQLEELFASGADLDSGGSAVQTGSTGTIQVYLNATAATDTIVNLNSDNPAVVEVPATITISEFEDGQGISFVAAAAGVATITAELNGQVLTTKIAVSDTIALSSVTSVSPIQAGTQGGMTLNLDVAAAADTTISLTSSNPAVVTIPATTVVFAGESTGFATFQALAAGSSTLTATLGAVTKSVTVNVEQGTTLTVFAVQADFLRTEARFLAGTTIELTFSLSSGPSVDTPIQLTSSDPSVVNLPSSVTMPAGFTFISFSFPTAGPGSTTLTATLNGVSLEVKLTFVSSPSITDIDVAGQLLTGTSTTLGISIDVTMQTDTAVSLSSSNASVLNVPATLVIPAGKTSATTPLTAGVSGTTLITATLGSSQQFTGVSVVSQVVLSQVNGGSTLEVGAIGSVNASLNTGAPTDKTVTVSVSPAGILFAPPSFVFPAGFGFGSFIIQALAPGDAIITCTLDGVTRQTPVKVVDHASVDSIFGSVPLNGPGSINIGLNAVVSADTVVTITNSNPAAFTTPASVIVFAGDSNVSLQVFGLAAVPTTITATLGASSVNTTITPTP